MRIIKLALLSIFFLFLVLVSITFLLPSNIRLSKVISIQANKDSIFSIIKNKENWYRWHPAFSTGSTLKQRQDLEKIKLRPILEKDSVLQMQWQFNQAEPLQNEWRLTKLSEDGSTVLQWTMNFELSWYPWKKLGSLFYEAKYGTMMEQGLNNIKNELQ